MDIKEKLIEMSMKSPNAEICHFLCKKGDEFYIKKSENKSPDPKNYFFIPAIDFLKAKKENHIVAIFHSHIYGPTAMSEFDRATSDNSCIPMVSFSNSENKFGFYIPKYSDIDVKDIEELKEILND